MMFSLQLSKIFRRCSAQGADIDQGDNRRWLLSLASSLETSCTGCEIAGLATGTSSDVAGQARSKVGCGAMTGEQREAPSMVTLPNQSEIEPRFAPGSSAAGTRF